MAPRLAGGAPDMGAARRKIKDVRFNRASEKIR
jgi:hypothetical protein